MSKTLDDWRGCDTFTLSEAALLIIEEYPDDWADTSKLIKDPPRRFLPIYKRLLIAATTVIDENAESEENPSLTYIQYELDTDKPEGVDKLSLEDGLVILVWHGRLKKWLKRKSIESKFFDDDELTEFGASEDDSPTKSHVNVSRQLSILNQASSKFWANADRSDRDTHPLNADVAKWFREHDFTDTVANSAASIIRPEWAPTGRKPEK